MIRVNILNGHIFVPPDVDRDKYVKTCYKRERVSVILEDGQGILFNCYIDKQTLKDIRFPQTSKNLGSLVSVIKQYGKIGIILGAISYEDESSLMKEDDIFIERYDVDGNYSGLRGNAKEGNLSLKCENNENSAILDITVSGKNNTGKINIRVNNEFNVRSTSKTNIESFGEVSLKSLNKDNEGEYTEIKINNNNINIVSKGTVDINNGNLTIEA